MESQGSIIDQPSLTPARVAVFGIALVGVPILALFLFVYGAASDTGDAFRSAVVPSIVGAALGILMVGLRPIRSARIRKGGRWERVALGAVSLAALLGVIGNDLPRWVNAGVEGWATGFFLALTFFLLRLWRRDPEFRRRIKAVRSSRS
jgi:hypothetical protein